MGASERSSVQDRDVSPSRTGFLLFSLVSLCGALLDLTTKAWLFQYPEGGAPFNGCPPLLRLTRAWNPGIVWGFFPGRGGDLFLAVSLVALPLLVWIASRTERLWPLAGLALVTAGTAGNLYDRFLFGKVRDFIQFDLGFWPCHPWPDFNVADSMICVGVGILLFTVGGRGGPAGRIGMN